MSRILYLVTYARGGEAEEAVHGARREGTDIHRRPAEKGADAVSFPRLQPGPMVVTHASPSADGTIFRFVYHPEDDNGYVTLRMPKYMSRHRKEGGISYLAFRVWLLVSGISCLVARGVRRARCWVGLSAVGAEDRR